MVAAASGQCAPDEVDSCAKMLACEFADLLAVNATLHTSDSHTACFRDWGIAVFASISRNRMVRLSRRSNLSFKLVLLQFLGAIDDVSHDDSLNFERTKPSGLTRHKLKMGYLVEIGFRFDRGQNVRYIGEHIEQFTDRFKHFVAPNAGLVLNEPNRLIEFCLR